MASSEGTNKADTSAASPSAPTSATAPGTAPDYSGMGTRREDREAPPPGPEAAKGQGISDRVAFQITCLRNTRYHEDRERFFARWHKVTMFVVVLGGAASFAPLETRYWIAGSIVTVAGLVDLVFDVSGKARLHASLRRRIYEILAEAEDNTVDLAKLKRRAIEVYADEPPCMHAANALAYNGAMAAFERPPKLQFKISFWQRILRNVWPYPDTVFKTYEEVERVVKPA